jgi:hypothetical protein
MLDVPVSAVRISGSRRGLALNSVRYSGPGESDLGVSTPRHWRSDFDEVLAAMHAGGASIDLTGSQRDAVGTA